MHFGRDGLDDLPQQFWRQLTARISHLENAVGKLSVAKIRSRNGRVLLHDNKNKHKGVN